MYLIHRAILSPSSNLIKRLSLAQSDRAQMHTHARTHTHKVAIVSGQHVRTTSFSINEFSVETHLFFAPRRSARGSLSFSEGFFFTRRIISRETQPFSLKSRRRWTAQSSKCARGGDFIIPYSHRIIPALYNFRGGEKKKAETYAPRTSLSLPGNPR